MPKRVKKQLGSQIEFVACTVKKKLRSLELTPRPKPAAAAAETSSSRGEKRLRYVRYFYKRLACFHSSSTSCTGKARFRSGWPCMQLYSHLSQPDGWLVNWNLISIPLPQAELSRELLHTVTTDCMHAGWLPQDVCFVLGFCFCSLACLPACFRQTNQVRMYALT